MNMAIYNRLLYLARQRKLNTYGEVAPLAGLSMDNIGDRTEISRLLHEIICHEAGEQRPLLTALVVLSGERNPGIGFYNASTELGRYGGSNDELIRLEFWSNEVNRVYDYWANH